MELKETLAKIKMLEDSMPQSTRPETIYAKSMLMVAEVMAKGLIISVDVAKHLEEIHRRLAEIEESLRQLLTPYHQALEESLIQPRPNVVIHPYGPQGGEAQTQEVPEPEPAAFNLEDEKWSTANPDPDNIPVNEKQLKDRVEARKKAVIQEEKPVDEVDAHANQVDTDVNLSTEDAPAKADDDDMDSLDMEQGPPDPKTDPA